MNERDGMKAGKKPTQYLNRYSPEYMFWEQFGIKLEDKNWFSLGIRNASAINSYVISLFDGDNSPQQTVSYSVPSNRFTGLPLDAEFTIFVNGVSINNTGSPVTSSVAQLLIFLNALGYGTWANYTDTVNSSQIFYIQSATALSGATFGNLFVKNTSQLPNPAYAPTAGITFPGTEVFVTTASGTYIRLNNDINNAAYLMHEIIASSPDRTTPFRKILTFTCADANGVTNSFPTPMLNYTDAYQFQTGLLMLKLEEKMGFDGNQILQLTIDPLESIRMLFFYKRNVKMDDLAKALTKIKA